MMGLRWRKFWLGLVLAGIIAFPVSAQAPDQAHRTATWYANNPGVLQAITKACRDDPGHSRNTPDCVNAEQGRVLAAEREAISHRNATDLTPPSDPNYWRIHPSEIALQQATCARLPNDPKVQEMNFCPSFRRFMKGEGR